MKSRISRIFLAIQRAEGRDSTAEIEGAPIKQAILDAAEELLHTMTTGERPVLEGLYDACATAFGTSRDDAKERLLAAMHGMRSARIDDLSREHTERTRSRAKILSLVSAARRERNEAQAAVDAWTTEHESNDPYHRERAPGWDRFVRAEVAYGCALRALEAWFDSEDDARTHEKADGGAP